MSDDRLRCYLDALKSGKRVSFNFSEDYNGYIESNYYLISFDAVVEKYLIETKNVVDGGYPDVEISMDNCEMDIPEFELTMD
jgi:hypothetical protein